MLKRTAAPMFSSPAGGGRRERAFASIPALVVQPKSGVNWPGAAQEREADRAANAVMSGAPPVVASMRPVGIDRKTAEAATRPAAMHDAVDRLGSGQPLDGVTRAFFESRFGHNFGNVRVHVDHSADAAARSVGARAFTSGSDVAFGAGQFAPHSAQGRRLLAHELTHVVQQRHGLAPAGAIQRDEKKPAAAEDWDFTPTDYAALKKAGKDLTIAADSSWMPKKLQENLLKTLAYVLDPRRKPSATEGVNVKDFYHGHVVIPKDPGISAAAMEKRSEFEARMEKETTKALGGEFKPVTEKNIGAYTKAIETSLPLFGTALEEGIKAKGAAVIYHTFEFKSPSDLVAKGKRIEAGDPRRNYKTPLDTNAPAPYTPPDRTNASSYARDYYSYLQFAFLIDNTGAVHVRPSTTTQLSSVTGKPIN